MRRIVTWPAGLQVQVYGVTLMVKRRATFAVLPQELVVPCVGNCAGLRPSLRRNLKS